MNRTTRLSAACTHPRLERVPRSSRIREDLVNRVRREIANGTYETVDKLEKALERLMDRWSVGTSPGSF